MKYQTQKVALLYFYGALGLFLAQLLFGVVAPLAAEPHTADRTQRGQASY